jgi:hypothetical protein
MSSDNLPAIVPSQPAREVATTDTDSWVQVVGQVAKLADHISGTEFVPRQLRGSAPAVAAAILYGREVGLPPMTALTQTHVIEGRPSMSAEAMRALVLAQGHQIEFLETTGAVCRMRARRSGSDTWAELMWTIDMARAASLTGKDNWKKYPRAMLVARCTADLCRMVFPDVIHGFRAVEEMDDVASPDLEPDQIPAGPTTKVARKRAPAKKVAASSPPPLEARRQPEPVEGPPLPGEDGYDTAAPAPEPVEEVAAGGPVDSTPAVSGEDSAASSTPDPPEESSSPEADTKPRKVSAAQRRMLMGSFNRLGLTDDSQRDHRLAITSDIVGRQVTSTGDLTPAEASRAIDTLARVKDLDGLVQLLEQTADGRDD